MCRWCWNGCGGCCWNTGDRVSDIICMKYVLIGLNLFMWVFAAFMFGLAAWIKWEEAFQIWVRLLEMQHYWYGVHVLMWTAVCVMVLSIFGVIAALVENTKFLVIYMCCCIGAFILELAGGAYMLNNGIEDAKINTWLDDRFYELIYISDYDRDARTVLTMIQYFVGCCGSQGGGDYALAGKDTPPECRSPIDGNEYNDGCGEIFSEFLMMRSAWLAAFAICLCVLQLYMIWASWRIRKELKAEKKEEEEEGKYIGH